MEQKVVLITGGSSGIGRAIGIHLKANGLRVYGTTRSLAKHTRFNDFDLLEMDVNDAESIEKGVRCILEREGRLDVLVNNAGVGITGPIEETPIDEALKAFQTNLMGPIRMMQAVLPQMRSQKGGLIINITSIAGYMGLPYRGIYSATKGSLGLLSEALRMEVKDFGVQVATLAPGDYATNIAAGRYHVPLARDSSYWVPYGKTLEAINDDVAGGRNPAEVAERVFRIIQSQRPKVHYKVGAPLQLFSLFLKRILSDKIYEKLLLNHYKL